MHSEYRYWVIFYEASSKCVRISKCVIYYRCWQTIWYYLINTKLHQTTLASCLDLDCLGCQVIQVKLVMQLGILPAAITTLLLETRSARQLCYANSNIEAWNYMLNYKVFFINVYKLFFVMFSILYLNHVECDSYFGERNHRYEIISQ